MRRGEIPERSIKEDVKMKLSECNARQRKAFLNIKYAADWVIGGLENTMMDCRPESPEYKSAEAQLNDHEGLVDYIYQEAITCIYQEGFSQFGKAAESYLKDVRFCGKDWLMARVEARVKKCGY